MVSVDTFQTESSCFLVRHFYLENDFTVASLLGLLPGWISKLRVLSIAANDFPRISPVTGTASWMFYNPTQTGLVRTQRKRDGLKKVFKRSLGMTIITISAPSWF